MLVPFAMRRPVILTLLLLVVAAAVVFLGVAKVAADLNATPGDLKVVFGIFGMPIVVGLRQAGHRRLEFGWGVLVLLIAPFLIGQLWALWHIVQRRPAMG